jgi:hypothetical protein
MSAPGCIALFALGALDDSERRARASEALKLEMEFREDFLNGRHEEGMKKAQQAAALRQSVYGTNSVGFASYLTDLAQSIRTTAWMRPASPTYVMR